MQKRAAAPGSTASGLSSAMVRFHLPKAGVTTNRSGTPRMPVAADDGVLTQGMFETRNSVPSIDRKLRDDGKASRARSETFSVPTRASQRTARDAAPIAVLGKKGYDRAAMLDLFETAQRRNKVHFDNMYVVASVMRHDGRGELVGQVNAWLRGCTMERQIIDAGHGWFHTPRGWVEARPVSIRSVEREGEAELPAVVMTLQPLAPNGRPFDWDSGGRCQVEPPPGCASSCCTIC